MAETSHINRWLLDAEDAVGSDVAKQIEWLREQRKNYSQAVRDGDWEHSQITNEGGSTAMKRGVSDQQNHDAIVGALARLGATDLGQPGGIIIPTFGCIQN